MANRDFYQSERALTAQILDGKAVALTVLDETRERVAALNARGKEVALATVLVGDDPASHAYVRSKRKRAGEVGIRSEHHELPADLTQEQVIEILHGLNADPAIDGILLQLPLPKGLDVEAATMQIDPGKDVDGLHPTNLGMIVLDKPQHVPNTPAGCMRILEHYGIPVKGANVVVVGRSFLVGRPLALLMAARGADATVTIAHSRTKDLAAVTRQVDIVVAAVGIPEMLTADHIRPGAVVIDVGINRVESGGLVGDVAYDEVSEIASAITPVPGGVGPMTVAMLMRSTAMAAEMRV
jgi:methylenetetrahydrofolate dehydrogenase (NADP+)/methenyltetrahydrofolate cyclohydrolase